MQLKIKLGSTRNKRAKLNILISVVTQIISLLCGFIVPRAMIESFGSDVYGATTSIAQFLAYITLLEGGIGGVARSVLYKPLALKDMDKVGAILYELKRFFRIIAFIFLGYSLVLAVLYFKIANVQCLDYLTTFALVIVISASTFMEYYIGITNSVLLQASQRSYVINAIKAVTTVINAIAIVILTSIRCNIITVKIISSLIFMIRPVIMWAFVKYNFNINKKCKSNEVLISQKWTGLGQHIAFFLHSNTDIALLTLFLNLSLVAVYSIYNMIVSHLKNLVTSFTVGMEAMFGDMLAKKEYDELKNTFNHYETLISFVAVVLLSTTFVLIIPFIKLYTNGISDVNYIELEFAMLIVLESLIYCLRTPYHSLVIASGSFKQTRIASYGEAALNIILSILLIKRYKLIGVAIGTLVATTFRYFLYIVYLSKQAYGHKTRICLRRFIINVSIFFCNCFFCRKIISNYIITNYYQWVIWGFIIFALCFALTFIVNFSIYTNEFKVLLKKKK